MRPIYYVIFTFLSLSFLSNAALAQIGDIRVYCFYVPKEKMGAEVSEQIRAITWAKLLTKEKTDFITQGEFKNGVYFLNEKEYSALFKQCQDAVGDAGNINVTTNRMVDLKATDASRYETFTRFYRITADFSDPKLTERIVEGGITKTVPVTEFLKPIDDDLLRKLGFNEGDVTAFRELEPGALRKLYETLKNSTIARAAGKVAELAGNPYVAGALAVSGYLAALWFGPAYVAYGVELLYPQVFTALFGPPSTLTYYTVYMPGKMHAVNWAYNNAPLIISAGTTLASLLGSAVYGLYKYATTSDPKPNKKTINQNLQQIADALPSS